MKLFRHRNHDRCSIYAPCRRADLDASWEAFRRRVDDPATGEETVAAELRRILSRTDLDGKRY